MSTGPSFLQPQPETGADSSQGPSEARPVVGGSCVDVGPSCRFRPVLSSQALPVVPGPFCQRRPVLSSLAGSSCRPMQARPAITCPSVRHTPVMSSHARHVVLYACPVVSDRSCRLVCCKRVTLYNVECDTAPCVG